MLPANKPEGTRLAGPWWSFLQMGKLRHAEVREFLEDHQPGVGGGGEPGFAGQLALGSELMTTR